MFVLMLGLLAFSVITNVALVRSRVKFTTKLRAAEKGKRMYRNLKGRLERNLESWERMDYCENCKSFAPKHKLDCPSMLVRFAITKAEQVEA